MDCPNCEVATVSVPLTAEYREMLPGDSPGAAVCTRCLRLHPVGDPPAEDPDLTAVSDAFPGNAAAVPLALLVGLLDSLATHRAEITDLLAAVERAGIDPFLAVNRLADDPGVDAAVDLRRRRHQLEQFL